MRQPPPHSSARAFVEDQQRRHDEAQAAYEQQAAWGRPTSRGREPPPFESVSPANWTEAPPPYDWIVDGCFLRGTVAMISGDGGLGKSLLMQQLCTAAALGQSWLGLETKPCKAFAVFCEDDLDELRRRQHWINRHYRCEPADLAGRVEYAARVGQENILVEFDRRTDQPRFMPLLEQLKEKIRSIGAQIVVLDTLADVFAGNEIVRNQVRRFVSALRKVALEVQGVIILTAHPSLTGMNSGTGLSGSTGWNNSVRSRLYLTRATTRDGNEEEDTNERLLKTMKNNQGPWGGKIRLRWENGVFVRADQAAPAPTLLDKLEIDVLLADVLRSLVRHDTRVAADPYARNGFATLARATAEAKHLGWKEVVSAQERMLASGKILKVELGSGTKRRAFLRTPDLLYPGEAKASE